MSETPSRELTLARTGKQEKEYDWLGAAESCKIALGLFSKKDVSPKGELHERSGYALYRAALQAESVEEFRERMRQAITNHKEAREFYEGDGEPGRTARALRCDAMIAYLGYWLAPDFPEKRRLLDESRKVSRESLKAFEKSGDGYGYGKTYNQLHNSSTFLFNLQWDFEAKEKMLREELEHGEQAVRFLSTSGVPDELARACVITSYWLRQFTGIIPDPEEQEKYSQKSLDYWKNAKKLSEEAALLQLPAGGPSLGLGSEEALTALKRALEHSKKARDRLMAGFALEYLAFHTFWKGLRVEDQDESAHVLKEAVQYAEEAKNQYAPILFISPGTDILGAESPYAEYYLELARFETDLEKKRARLEESRDAASHHLKRGEDAGYPMAISGAHHILSKTFAALAKIEKNPQAKGTLLESALAHRNEGIRIEEQLAPCNYWNRGVFQNYLADIRSELARLAEEPEDKKKLILEAILTKENCLKLCSKETPFLERTGSLSHIAWIGQREMEFGDQLNSLHVLSDNREPLNRAAKAFECAVELFEKSNQSSRVAECYWKVAQVDDSLGEHLKAAKEFSLASHNYRLAAEKIRQLKKFYDEHALYMEAWSDIEKARYHHTRQEYGSAKKCYDHAATLHRSTRQWNFLAFNYSAWAEVENAEDLSRKEQGEEAGKAFDEAAKLFLESKRCVQAELAKIESLDEKQMASRLAEAADLREEYCRVRIILEEAKTLDRKGEHQSSSEKYGVAVESFEKILRRLESDTDIREFKLIITLSRAWQLMTRAEASDSPQLYLEASRFFEEAKLFSPTEKTTMLSSGHSRFCKALEAGTRFADTRETLLHTSAMSHLESAANYYLKAGFESASEYAKATGLLFDAYAHSDKAKREEDPEKKAKLYMMTERILQASADSYSKAQYPGKTREVLGLLEKIRQERELAGSLVEVLHSISILSTTSSFATPTPTFERAVGLERFEHADVRANLISRPRDLRVGERLDLEIELVNAGRGSAQLVKLEEIIPEGFELTEKPEPYRLEDSYLNMKGKRLDALKTEEVKLALKPNVQGQFTLKPRILYLDESGVYKSHEPEPIEVTVKELGISGWLRGR